MDQPTTSEHGPEGNEGYCRCGKYQCDQIEEYRYAGWHGGPSTPALDYEAAVDRILQAQGD